MSDKTKYCLQHSYGDQQELTIFSVDKSDEGIYQLLAENVAGEGKSKPYVLNFKKGLIYLLLVIATIFILALWFDFQHICHNFV